DDEKQQQLTCEPFPVPRFRIVSTSEKQNSTCEVEPQGMKNPDCASASTSKSPASPVMKMAS
ncbi:unnamed protein product, partial [Amoebophrya sp. A25]